MASRKKTPLKRKYIEDDTSDEDEEDLFATGSDEEEEKAAPKRRLLYDDDDEDKNDGDHVLTGSAAAVAIREVGNCMPPSSPDLLSEPGSPPPTQRAVAPALQQQPAQEQPPQPQNRQPAGFEAAVRGRLEEEEEEEKEEGDQDPAATETVTGRSHAERLGSIEGGAAEEEQEEAWSPEWQDPAVMESATGRSDGGRFGTPVLVRATPPAANTVSMSKKARQRMRRVEKKEKKKLDLIQHKIDVGDGFPHFRQYCNAVGEAVGSANISAEEAAQLFCKACYCYVCDKPASECTDWDDCHCHAKFDKFGGTEVKCEGRSETLQKKMQALNHKAWSYRKTHKVKEYSESILLQAATRVYEEEIDPPGNRKLLLNHHQRQCVAFMRNTESPYDTKRSGWICSGM